MFTNFILYTHGEHCGDNKAADKMMQLYEINRIIWNAAHTCYLRDYDSKCKNNWNNSMQPEYIKNHVFFFPFFSLKIMKKIFI